MIEAPIITADINCWYFSIAFSSKAFIFSIGVLSDKYNYAILKIYFCMANILSLFRSIQVKTFFTTVKWGTCLEDLQIIELYWQRDEQAITETGQKYGRFCSRIAMNILCIREDAEECVSDTYHRVWNSIPPERPNAFLAWLGRIVRNLSLNRYQKNRAQKRYSGMDTMLSELEECIPSPGSVEQSIETAELSNIINEWLKTLPHEDCTLFVRRYWNGDSLSDIAKEMSVTSGKLAQRMYRLRKSLRIVLEKKGITI